MLDFEEKQLMTPILRTKSWQEDQNSVASKLTADTYDTDLRRDQEEELNDAETLQLLTSMQMTLHSVYDILDPVGEVKRCQEWLDVIDQI